MKNRIPSKILVSILASFMILLVYSCSDGESPTTDGDVDTSDGDHDGDEPAEGSGVKVMSFNIRFGTADDGENSWGHRKDILIETLTQHDADIVGTQEAHNFQIDYIVNALPDYAWVGESRYEHLEDEYCAILYKSADFTLMETDTYWLGDNPEQPGSTFTTEQCCPRIVTWARLKRNADGQVFVIMNTHFSLDGEAREKSAELIVQRLSGIAQSHPVILTGDFNTAPASAPYAALTAALPGNTDPVFMDPWIELGMEEEGTFHGFLGIGLSGRIDWVFHSSDLAATRAGVITYNREGFYPSDHYPVFGVFQVSP